MIRKLTFALVALLVSPLVASAATFTQQLDYTGQENKLISQTFHAVVRGVDAQGTPIVAANPGLLQNNDIIVTLYRVQSLLVNNVNKAFTDGAVLYSVTKYIAPGGLIASADPYNKLTSANATTNVLGLFNPASLPAMTGIVKDDITNNVTGSALILAANSNNATDYLIASPAGGIATPLLKLFNMSQNGGSLQLAADVTNGTDLTGYDINPFPGVGQWFSGGTSTVSFALVPEPGTIALWGAALAVGAVVTYRRRKQS